MNTACVTTVFPVNLSPQNWGGGFIDTFRSAVTEKVQLVRGDTISGIIIYAVKSYGDKSS